LVHEKKLDNLHIKASDITTATSKDPVLKQVKHFVLKGWPKQAPNQALVPYFRCKNHLTIGASSVVFELSFFPSIFHSKLLHILHETHPGKVQMNFKALAHSYVHVVAQVGWTNQEHE